MRNTDKSAQLLIILKCVVLLNWISIYMYICSIKISSRNSNFRSIFFSHTEWENVCVWEIVTGKLYWRQKETLHQKRYLTSYMCESVVYGILIFACVSLNNILKIWSFVFLKIFQNLGRPSVYHDTPCAHDTGVFAMNIHKSLWSVFFCLQTRNMDLMKKKKTNNVLRCIGHDRPKLCFQCGSHSIKFCCCMFLVNVFTKGLFLTSTTPTKKEGPSEFTDVWSRSPYRHCIRG